MSAATKGIRWNSSQVSGGGSQGSESDDAASLQESFREKSQSMEPVAEQPKRTCSSSSRGALQQGQEGEAIKRWRCSRSWCGRQPALTRASHLMTVGRAGWWKLEALTVGRRKMEQDTDQSMSVEE